MPSSFEAAAYTGSPVSFESAVRYWARDCDSAEHAAAGSENHWIRVGQHSVQSRQIQTFHIEEPLDLSVGWAHSDYD